MNCFNTLYIIASFLDLQTLASFAAVNRLFYKITQKSALWKALMAKEYFQDYNSFGYYTISDISRGSFWRKPLQDEPNWKIILKKRVELLRIPKVLPCGSTLQDRFGQLISLILDAFSCPEIPLPNLYRDFSSFATVYQNLLACEIHDELPTVCDPLHCEIFENIVDESELGDCPAIFISSFREYRGSYFLSESECWGEFGFSESSCWVRVLAKLINFLIFCHCQATLAFISTLSEGQELLSEYVRRWEAFSATMHQVCGFLSHLNSTLSDSALPETWVFELSLEMRKIWKTQVFSQIETELHEIILNLFQIQRKTIVNKLIRSDNTTNFFDPIENLLKQAVLAIADLDLDRNNFCFLRHSRFVSSTYLQLHLAFEDQCRKIFLELENSDLPSSTLIYKSDAILTQLIWLPFTVSKLECLRKKSELMLREKIFLQDSCLVNDLSPCSELYSPYLQTNFSIFLRKNGKTCKNVLSFLNLLNELKRLNEVAEYNMLVNSIGQKTGFEMQDLEIEILTARFGLKLNDLQGK